jgi:serine/threonine-protein kinase HipA
MRSARVLVHAQPAATLTELDPSRAYRLVYDEGYEGPPVSLALPVRGEPYEFTRFPAFFDGLLPEGPQLQGLLRSAKLDHTNLFGQLVAVGADLVGAVTVAEIQP